MDVYLYQGDLLCEECVYKVIEGLETIPEDPSDETTYDSDDYPKGPYPDGGGEADSPQHCDSCSIFLENPLTSDGVRYVQEALARGRGPCLKEWADHYNIRRIE